MSGKTELPELWERQPHESEQAYYAFQLYRDQSPPRHYAGVISDLGRSKTLIHGWGSKWFWRDRARAWDRHKEEVVRREEIRATREMARRQARDAQAYQMVLRTPVEVALRKLADPLYREELERMKIGDLIALSILTARAFPRVARAEREARGAPIQDLTQFLDDDTGEVKAPADAHEEYDWMRGALIALEQATSNRKQLPPGGTTDG